MVLNTYCFEDVNAIAQNIDGWLMPVESKLLYNTAKSLKGTGAIVEIGSWCSKSLTYLVLGALASNNNCKKISIDPFLNSKDEPNGQYETFINNLKRNKLYDEIIHIKEKSQIAGKTFDEKIEFLFIDGFHKYDAVKEDFNLFSKNVVENGFIAIHDVACYEGPTRLVTELMENNSLYKFDFLGITAILQKVEQLSEQDKENNKKVFNKLNEIIETKQLKI